MIDGDGSLLKGAYIGMAAIAGAVTALALTQWKDLTRTEIAMTFVVGFSFAIFVTPWLASAVFGIDSSNVRAVAGLTYIFGSGSNILLPVIIRWVGRIVGHLDSTTGGSTGHKES